MAKHAYVGAFVAVDAPELFKDPDFRAWLEAEPRARWNGESACCDSLFTHVLYDFDYETGEHHLEGSDIATNLEGVPQKAVDVIVEALRDAGFDHFEGLVWLRGSDE